MEETVLINYDPDLQGVVLHTPVNHFYAPLDVFRTNFFATECELDPNNVGVSNEVQVPQVEIVDAEIKGKQEDSYPQVKKISQDFCKKNFGKELGPDCCCSNKCYEKIGEETIHKIFRDFWALADYNSQNAYLFGLINLLGVKRRYTKKETSRRNFTITYYVNKKGQNVTVCKTAFLNIHGLQRNRGRVNNLANKMKEGESVPPFDRRGRHTNRPNAYSEEAVEHVRKHLFHCSKAEVRTSKLTAVSTKGYYDLYVNEYCKENGLIPVSLDKFRRIFSKEGYKRPQNSRGSK